MMIERRKHPRFNAVLPAMLELPDGHRITVNTSDLSREGAKIKLAERLPAGIQVMMELTAPDPEKGRKTVQIWGSTLHSKSTDQDEFSLGLHFQNTTSDYKGLILSLNPSALH